MDEEMEDIVDGRFIALIDCDYIDFGYEYDASRYFDFTREETAAEARAAELWFETAQSYPPSPFVAKLVLRNDVFQLENVCISQKLEDVGHATLHNSDSGIGLSTVDSVMNVNTGTNGGMFTNLQSESTKNLQCQPPVLLTGLTFCGPMGNDNAKTKTEAAIKRMFPTKSTLMKPTASQLAKQNRQLHADNCRFQKLVGQIAERSLNIPCGVESQAAKRQKLEGGHLRKVADSRQEPHLVHKVPGKDATGDRNSECSRLKLTIPRGPEFETAMRARRMRNKSSAEAKHGTLISRTFKARPLNRKILEGPLLPLPKRSTPQLPEFQEFHLKTSERATQQTSAGLSSLLHRNKGLQKTCTNSGTENENTSRRPNMKDPNQDGFIAVQHFKARPLNKKIFSSKGDIGVFRNNKRETTVPVEFNFQTDRRIQHDPPIELFDKLSLASDLQPSTGTQMKSSRGTCIHTKGSKENRFRSSELQHERTNSVKETPSRVWEKHTRCANDRSTEVFSRSRLHRGLGIR